MRSRKKKGIQILSNQPEFCLRRAKKRRQLRALLSSLPPPPWMLLPLSPWPLTTFSSTSSVRTCERRNRTGNCGGNGNDSISLQSQILQRLKFRASRSEDSYIVLTSTPHSRWKERMMWKILFVDIEGAPYANSWYLFKSASEQSLSSLVDGGYLNMFINF